MMKLLKGSGELLLFPLFAICLIYVKDFLEAVAADDSTQIWLLRKTDCRK